MNSKTGDKKKTTSLNLQSCSLDWIRCKSNLENHAFLSDPSPHFCLHPPVISSPLSLSWAPVPLTHTAALTELSSLWFTASGGFIFVLGPYPELFTGPFSVSVFSKFQQRYFVFILTWVGLQGTSRDASVNWLFVEIYRTSITWPLSE